MFDAAISRKKGKRYTRDLNALRIIQKMDIDRLGIEKSATETS